MAVTQDRVSISVKQAAEIIGISERKAYYLAGRNELPGAYRMAGRVLVHVPTLLADLESRATAPAQSSTVGPVVGSTSDTASAPLRGPAHGGVSHE
jgi:hypothetical protein